MNPQGVRHTQTLSGCEVQWVHTECETSSYCSSPYTMQAAVLQELVFKLTQHGILL